MRKLTVAEESWPIAGNFTISRGSRTHTDVVVVTIEENGATGRGECVPYGRYGETVAATVAALEQARPEIEATLSRQDIAKVVAPKAARNALDCALWDLEAKQMGRRVWQLAGLPPPKPLVTAFTLSLDTPSAMAAAAAAAQRPLLKLKLGREGDPERLRLVRRSAPQSRLIVDANEGWTPEILPELFDICAETGVELVEQPLPAGNDDALLRIARPIRVCADESAHDSEGLARLVGKYDAVNIKLDKTGGLTEALAMAAAAKKLQFGVMVGCMVATSLSMAPAMLVAQSAQVVDLDGPLLLQHDRTPGIAFNGSLMHPAPPELWG